MYTNESKNKLDNYFPTLEDARDSGLSNCIDIKEFVKKVAAPEPGSKDSKYGRIVNSRLYYKGRVFTIKMVHKDCLEVEIRNMQLFGQWGDEFPLDLIR